MNRLPPSVNHKVQAHIDEIEFCKSILPVTALVLEVSQFDTALMKNPSLINEKVRSWGYQKGFNYDFSCRREAVLTRDKYTCQICSKKNARLEVHHIIYRSQGGTDDENNLITLCKSCHDNIHNGSFILTKKPKKMNLKHATHMSIIRSRLLKKYPEAIETFGFVTYENRNHLSLPKSHYLDACVIASGGQPFQSSSNVFLKRRVPCSQRVLTWGKRSEKARIVGKVRGIRKFDIVSYDGNIFFVRGLMSTGYCTLMNIFGKQQVFTNPRTVKLDALVRLSARKSVLVFNSII